MTTKMTEETFYSQKKDYCQSKLNIWNLIFSMEQDFSDRLGLWDSSLQAKLCSNIKILKIYFIKLVICQFYLFCNSLILV